MLSKKSCRILFGTQPPESNFLSLLLPFYLSPSVFFSVFSTPLSFLFIPTWTFDHLLFGGSSDRSSYRQVRRARPLNFPCPCFSMPLLFFHFVFPCSFFPYPLFSLPLLFHTPAFHAPSFPYPCISVPLLFYALDLFCEQK